MWLKSISTLFIGFSKKKKTIFIKCATWQNLMLSYMRSLLIYIYIYILIDDWWLAVHKGLKKLFSS